jgi:hypothetical protein
LRFSRCVSCTASLSVDYINGDQQSLRANIFAAVNEFPDGPQKQRYLDAAVKVRLPYWDWAKAPSPGQYIMPASVVRSAVDLIGPRGKMTVENPLLQYRFVNGSGPPGGKEFPLPTNVSSAWSTHCFPHTLTR